MFFTPPPLELELLAQSSSPPEEGTVPIGPNLASRIRAMAGNSLESEYYTVPSFSHFPQLEICQTRTIRGHCRVIEAAALYHSLFWPPSSRVTGPCQRSQPSWGCRESNPGLLQPQPGALPLSYHIHIHIHSFNITTVSILHQLQLTMLAFLLQFQSY